MNYEEFLDCVSTVSEHPIANSRLIKLGCFSATLENDFQITYKESLIDIYDYHWKVNHAYFNKDGYVYFKEVSSDDLYICFAFFKEDRITKLLLESLYDLDRELYPESKRLYRSY